VQKLRDGIAETRSVMGGVNWGNEDHVYAAIAILVHIACHLGEIRQARCTISIPTRWPCRKVVARSRFRRVRLGQHVDGAK